MRRRFRACAASNAISILDVLSSVSAVAILVSSTVSIFLLCTFLCSRRHRFPSLLTVQSRPTPAAEGDSSNRDREETVNCSESYEIATSGLCRIDLSVMELGSNPPVEGDADQKVEGVPGSSAFSADARVPNTKPDAVYCNLRSTIPLRLDRKPPCRPILLPNRAADATLVQDKPPITSPIPPPPGPPPPPPKRPSPPDISSHGSTQIYISNRSSSGECTCSCTKEKGGGLPFNGVPPLLAVISTQDLLN